MSNIKFEIADFLYRDAEIEEQERKELEKQKQKHLEQCGIADKFWKSRFENFDAYTDGLKNALQTVKEFVADLKKGLNRSLWLCGNNGNGKTMLVACILYELGFGSYVKSYEIEDELEEAASFSSKESKKSVLQKYYTKKLLVIDEVGRFSSQKELAYLFRILNERYERNLPTILVTNLDKLSLKEYLGQALFDRFSEMCTSITFSEESYRTKIREVV
jgi:DNA replication protein DnaC